MNVGILGGTFDPVHIAHLALAEQARDQLKLDQVLFIPAGDPWRKTRAITPAEHRLAMLRQAIDGNDAFALSDIELRREGPTYTADTLEALAGERLDDAFWFIVGGDTLQDMPHWHEPKRIFRHARIAAAPRDRDERIELAWAQSDLGSANIDVFECPMLEISSTDIRERVAAGRSIRYLVPDSVAAYIGRHKLYHA